MITLWSCFCAKFDITKVKEFMERETVRLRKEGVTEFPEIFYLRER